MKTTMGIYRNMTSTQTKKKRSPALLLRLHLLIPRIPLRLPLVSRRAAERTRPRGGGARRAPRDRVVVRAIGAATARAHVREVGVEAAVATATAVIAVSVARAHVRTRTRGPPGNARIGNISALLCIFVDKPCNKQFLVVSFEYESCSQGAYQQVEVE